MVSDSSTDNPDDYFPQGLLTTQAAEEVQKIPSPTPAMVKRLAGSLSGSTVRAGASLIQCPSVWSATFLGLWIVAYWQELAEIREKHERWALAVDSLQKQSCSWKGKGHGSVHTADPDQVLNTLESLPWTGIIHGFSRDAIDDVLTLTNYISEEWLLDEHANQMLDLLRMDLEDEQKKKSIVIENTWFYDKLCQVCRNGDDCYSSDKTY